MNRCMSIYEEIDVIKKVNSDMLEDAQQRAESLKSLRQWNHWNNSEPEMRQVLKEGPHYPDALCSFSPWM